jgi:hypothetical protein
MKDIPSDDTTPPIIGNEPIFYFFKKNLLVNDFYEEVNPYGSRKKGTIIPKAFRNPKFTLYGMNVNKKSLLANNAEIASLNGIGLSELAKVEGGVGAFVFKKGIKISNGTHK